MNEFDYTIFDENDNEKIVTVEYNYTAGCKPRRYGHPDDWHDGEGPEIELTGATSGGVKMTRAEFDNFEKRYGSCVADAIAEYESDRRN